MKRAFLLALTALAFTILGCGRHVVLMPEEVSRLNSPDWTVKSSPTATEPVKKQ